jgi:hypothetical protein
MRGGFLYCLLSTRELSLNRERRDPLLFPLRVILTINTSRWELPLYRERRDPLLFALRVILTNNKSQIKMEVASLSREAGTFLVLALKAARGFPVHRKRRRQLPTTCYLCYQHVIPPYRPTVFTIFPKKEGPSPPSPTSVRFVSYSGYLQYEKKNDLKLHYNFCQQHITVD